MERIKHVKGEEVCPPTAHPVKRWEESHLIGHLGPGNQERCYDWLLLSTMLFKGLAEMEAEHSQQR